ncbi:DsbA family protein [Rickettsiales endosymbiont of Paramecium tredecaurelia]|uniref:thioredoxin domain-containing protein n=1 Tax=Candidatus Sarmatiella mevalonica TaxID=2770581 RepID=UPI00192102B9|nr:thioredoxin domain-containing protein [Candidatus Sarmatiella mevalonica]MBL3284415.1 DsbA family protein [Candidatus Sarmatiella mevalonica]
MLKTPIKPRIFLQIANILLLFIHFEVFARGLGGFHGGLSAPISTRFDGAKSIDLNQSDKHLDEAKTAVVLRNARDNQDYYNQEFYNGFGAAIGIDTISGVVGNPYYSPYVPYYYGAPAGQPYPTNYPTDNNIIINQPTNQNQTPQGDSQQNLQGDQSNTKNEDENAFNPYRSARDEEIFRILPRDIVLGDPQSKILVIEYFAYTCYHCSEYHNTTFYKIKEKYIDTNKVAYVLRTYVSNRLDVDASLLALCTGQPEDFKKITNDILSKQQEWINHRIYLQDFLEIAKSHGLTAEQCTTCLQNKELMKELITKSRAVHMNRKFIGTPAIYVNGERCSHHSFEILTRTIERAIKRTMEQTMEQTVEN